jgi:predicted metal-dependent phosphoesterase TrpH
MMHLVDFHLHTSCSDGVWAPERLFEEIRSRNLDLFSVSDHDNVNAYPVPEDLQPRCIPGLEVDSHHAGHTAHILAYGIDDDCSPLLTSLRTQREARLFRMLEMIERLNELGIAITIDDVREHSAGASSLGRPHLARALVSKGYVPTVQDAFDRYIADEGGAYVELARQTAAQTIDLIHRSGGVAIVAHPLRLKSEGALEQICELGADGIEVLHPTAGLEEEVRLRAFAEYHGLLITGGTDFHAPCGREIGVRLEIEACEALQAAIALRQATLQR